MNIVLKDSLAADVTFKFTKTTETGVIFDSVGTNLLDRKRLTFTLGENANVNRVKAKLSLPSVCISAPGCSPTVEYTQVGSIDYSIVRFADEKSRADVAALMASLTANAQVEELVTNGVMPS